MTLKQRFLLLIGLSTFFIASVVWFGSYLSNQYKDELIKVSNITSTQALLNSISTSRIKQMEGETKGLTRNKDLQKSLKSLDKASVSEAALPTFRRLNASKIIDQMLITDTQGKVLLNTPSSASAPVNNNLIQSVIETKKVQWDYLRFENGDTGLAYAFPLYRRGKPAGIAMYIQHSLSIVNELAESSKTQVVVLDKENNILISEDEKLGKAFIATKPLTDQAYWSGVKIGAQHFSVTTLPVKNKSNETVGILVTLNEDTELHSKEIKVENVSIGIGILALLGTLGLLYWQISKSFVPIYQAVEAMKYISNGDLTQSIKCGTKNEIADMLLGMDAMQKNLRTIIQQVLASSINLSAAAQNVANTSAQTNEGAIKQQSDTETVATAMTEMSASASAVANNAALAADSTQQAQDTTQHGQGIVTSSIAEMNLLAQGVTTGSEVIDTLRKESDAINGVLEVIRGIAEQTNLLALNAAIEAARAGEQGRGFAVVADEVRTLASRTQESTEEIYFMIERLQNGTRNAVEAMSSSKEQADKCVELIQNAGDSLDKVTASVMHSTEMNSIIAEAAKEQGIVAESISNSVMNISMVAENTAEQANQTATSSQELMNLANELESLMGQFKV